MTDTRTNQNAKSEGNVVEPGVEEDVGGRGVVVVVMVILLLIPGLSARYCPAFPDHHCLPAISHCLFILSCYPRDTDMLDFTFPVPLVVTFTSFLVPNSRDYFQ
ncbi:hypothetical protein Q8A73_012581 [Channa argus]|nr:hypothetical protein Q8A73_012581 [Channa argus]